MYKTLKEYYKEWNDSSVYYSNTTLMFPFDGNNQVDNCKDYISNYLNAGEKDRILDGLRLDDSRASHTVSTFLLGYGISSLFYPNDIDANFKYLWFLTCLLHDFAYVIENDTSLSETENLFDKLINGETHHLNSLSCLPDDYKDVLSNNKVALKFKTPYSKKIIRSYEKYSLLERGKIDHGIICGKLLFCGLINNHYRVKNSSIDFQSMETFIYKNLRFSPDVFPRFKEAAYAVVCHNIWFTYKNDTDTDNIWIKKKQLYEEYGLEKLIIEESNRNKLNCNKHRFLLLLCLADTLDPIKNITCCKEIPVLDNLELEIEGNRLSFKVVNWCNCYEKWFKNIKELERWTSLEIDVDMTQKVIKLKID